MNAPQNITVPPLYAGQTAEISWSPVEGASGYVLQRIFNDTFDSVEAGLSWLGIEAAFADWSDLEARVPSWGALYAWEPDYAIYTGSAAAYVDGIPTSATTAAYRARAADAFGGSAWTTSDVINVQANRAPVIGGEDGDLGNRTEGFSIVFSVSDPDPNSSIAVRVTLGGAGIFSDDDVTQGMEYAVALSDDTVAGLEGNVIHSITITATDNQGMSARRVYTFTATEIAQAAGIFFVLRDGVPVARLEEGRAWTDYMEAGTHTYVVRGVDAWDNYADSNAVTLTIAMKHAAIAAVDSPGSIFGLRLRRGDYPTMEYAFAASAEKTQFEGRKYPVLADSGQREGVWSFAFTHCAASRHRELVALADAGSPVVYRDPFGNRLVGVIDTNSSTFARRTGGAEFIDFALQITEIDYSEAIEYD